MYSLWARKSLYWIICWCLLGRTVQGVNTQWDVRSWREGMTSLKHYLYGLWADKGFCRAILFPRRDLLACHTTHNLEGLETWLKSQPSCGCTFFSWTSHWPGAQSQKVGVCMESTNREVLTGAQRMQNIMTKTWAAYRNCHLACE